MLLKVFEKRSNPDLNQKLTPLEQLEVYEGQPNIYVSFTKENKLGINPTTEFITTPVGVYCYPVDRVITMSRENMAGVPEEQEGGLTADFTGMEPWQYARVIRLDPSARVLTANITKSQYDRCIDILLGMDFGHRSGVIKDTIKSTVTIGRSLGIALYKLLQDISFKYNKQRVDTTTSAAQSVFTGLLRKLGYQAVEDEGYGFIHDNEPAQAVLFDPRSFKEIDVIRRAVGIEKTQYRWTDMVQKNPQAVDHIRPDVARRLGGFSVNETVRAIIRTEMDDARAATIIIHFLEKCDPRLLTNALILAASSVYTIIPYALKKLHGQELSLFIHRLDERAIDFIVRTGGHLTKTIANRILMYSGYFFNDIIKLLNHPERFDDFEAFKREAEMIIAR